MLQTSPATRRSAFFPAIHGDLPTVVRGEGIYLYDDTGRRFIDAAGGGGCVTAIGAGGAGGGGGAGVHRRGGGGWLCHGDRARRRRGGGRGGQADADAGVHALDAVPVAAGP